MSAKSMHSYSDTLYAVLDEFKVSTCFEWGPGISTQIMALHPLVQTVTSVEHEQVFYEIIERLRFTNVVVHCKKDMDDYVNALDKSYGLIFIDGRDRARCLDKASEFTDIVILHDAARRDYRESVNKYRFKTWTDEGNTVVLTNDEFVNERLKKILKECPEPEPERVYVVGPDKKSVKV